MTGFYFYIQVRSFCSIATKPRNLSERSVSLSPRLVTADLRGPAVLSDAIKTWHRHHDFHKSLCSVSLRYFLPSVLHCSLIADLSSTLKWKWSGVGFNRSLIVASSGPDKVTLGKELCTGISLLNKTPPSYHHRYLNLTSPRLEIQELWHHLQSILCLADTCKSFIPFAASSSSGISSAQSLKTLLP